MDELPISGKILAFALIAYSIILHEIAHGYAALKFGDDTAQRQGRLSLEPTSHIDPIGTIVFPLLQLMVPPYRVMLGWAKPVPVATHRLEPRVAGDIVVSIAGVCVNFLIAVAMAIFLAFVIDPVRSDWMGNIDWSRQSVLAIVLRQVMVANLGLLLFNLLPVPPLDGSHVMKYLLPSPLREQYQQVGFYGIFALLALSYLGFLSPIILPPLTFLYRLLFENITLGIAK